MSIQELFFWAFSILTLSSSFVVVTAASPVTSIMFLVLSFASAGSLLLLFGAEFIGIIFFIVYIGAIAIVFLFVIMMLNVKYATYENIKVQYLPVGALIALIAASSLYVLAGQDAASFESVSILHPAEAHIWNQPYVEWYSLLDGVTNVEGLGRVLYTDGVFPFVISSVILLIAMLIVITLTGFKYENVRHQDLFDQQVRTSEEAWATWDGKGNLSSKTS